MMLLVHVYLAGALSGSQSTSGVLSNDALRPDGRSLMPGWLSPAGDGSKIRSALVVRLLTSF